MSYGPLRFLYDNLITGVSMLTLSSQADGRISGAVKDGTGSATISIAGPFQGAFDLSYTLEIDSIIAGAEIGQATFKWRTSDTAQGAWEATGVTTVSTPKTALSADGLGTNISVGWTGGTGADFALGDRFYFEARASFGGERLLDRDRHTYWETTGVVSENIVINYGGATQVTAVVLHDHNLTDSATVTFQANAADTWGAPSYSSVFSTIEDPLVLYLDQTYQYNRWLIVDSTNTDGYLHVGNIIHTTYLELEKLNAEWGSQGIPGLQIQANESAPGIMRRHLYAFRNQASLDFGEVLSNNDIDSLITMQEALSDTDTKRILPLWVHQFSDENDTCRLCDWVNIAEWQRTYRSYLLNSGTSLQFSEVVKTT